METDIQDCLLSDDDDDGLGGSSYLDRLEGCESQMKYFNNNRFLRRV